MRDGPVLQIVNVLGLQHGQVDLDAGQVHVLALANRLVVLDPAHDRLLLELGHRENKRAVGDEDRRAHLDGARKRLVGAGKAGRVALVRIVRGELHSLARLQDDLLVALILEEARADLRALGVEEDAKIAVRAKGGRLAHAREAVGVGRVITVREVETGHIHARVHEIAQDRHIPAGRAHGAKDLGALLSRHCSYLVRCALKGRVGTCDYASGSRWH